MRVSGFLRTLLSNREWVYLLSLLVPLVIYNLSLKAASVASIPGLPLTYDLVLSDIFFGVGYALLMIGLFAVTRGKGPLRWAVLVFFHGATMLVVILNTGAYQYFRENGAALDYGAAVEWLAGNDAFAVVLADGTPSSGIWGLLLAAVLYAAFGPLVVTRAVERWRRRSGRPPVEAPRRLSAISSLGLLLLAIGFVSLSLMTGATARAKDPLVNVVLTGMEEVTTEEARVEETTSGEEVEETAGAGESEPGLATNLAAANASLAPTSQTEKRNVVLIHLESTRARSATPYNEDLKTMPFLNEVAKSSLRTELTHVVVPRSSKGSTATNCGVEPALFPGPEYEPGGIPAPCLAGLLKEQGYRTVWFQSLSDASNSYYDGVLARNYGYEEFYPAEVMNKEGFRETNTFGYEEDIMLEPSEAWLRENGGQPFLAEYFTGTGHYGYDCLPNRYGYEPFSDDEQLDRYHNCLRLLDHFLGNLFDQYKELGLYENTIFVLYGDHGEGFMEHGRYMHGDNPYEEGLHIPLVIHAPGWFEEGERAGGLSSQIDVLPTVLEMLDFEVENGEYPGYSLLHPLPEGRPLMSSCVYPYRCIASLKGTEKYIYHYGDQPDELYDLAGDPLEKRNLADERGEEALRERREELLAWTSKLDAEYSGFEPPPP